MHKKKPKRPAPAVGEVEAFLEELDHPLKKDIAEVRQIILGALPAIREGIKWNGPSFKLAEAADYFATMNLRSQDAVQLIFHRGAKVKDNSTKQVKLTDPAGLVKWLATDRCLVTVGAGKDIAKNRAALEGIVREWVKDGP